jgi:hypothetical protein
VDQLMIAKMQLGEKKLTTNCKTNWELHEILVNTTNTYIKVYLMTFSSLILFLDNLILYNFYKKYFYHLSNHMLYLFQNRKNLISKLYKIF